MKNYIANTQHCQTKSQNISSVNTLCLENIEEYLVNLPEHKRRMLNYILYIHAKFNIIYPNQTTIGKTGGVVRETANRFIAELVDLGYLKKKQRWNTSCLYGVSSIFTNIEARSHLSYILPALKTLLISSLLSGSITLIKSNLFINYQTTNIHSNRTTTLEKDIHIQHRRKTYNEEEYGKSRETTYYRHEQKSFTMKDLAGRTIILGKTCNFSPQLKFESNLSATPGNLVPLTRSMSVMSSSLTNSNKNQSEAERIIQDENSLKSSVELENNAKKYITDTIKFASGKIGFTTLAQVKLLIYPNAAIEYAMKKYERTKDVKNPFAMFSFFCKEYCRQNNIQENFKTANYIIAQCQLDEKGPLIERITPKRVVAYEPPKTTAMDENGFRKREDIQRIIDHIKKNGITSNEFLLDSLTAMIKQCSLKDQQEICAEMSMIVNNTAAEQYIKSKVLNQPDQPIQIEPKLSLLTIPQLDEPKLEEHFDINDEDQWEEIST